jgi:hypothetical protein
MIEVKVENNEQTTFTPEMLEEIVRALCGEEDCGVIMCISGIYRNSNKQGLFFQAAYPNTDVFTDIMTGAYQIMKDDKSVSNKGLSALLNAYHTIYQRINGNNVFEGMKDFIRKTIYEIDKVEKIDSKEKLSKVNCLMDDLTELMEDLNGFIEFIKTIAPTIEAFKKMYDIDSKSDV